MNVLDPPTISSSYPLFLISSTPFAVSFTPCLAGELPGGLSAEGCFAGRNVTGHDWNNLQLTFANNSVLNGQASSCGTTDIHNVYSSSDCSLTPDGSTYILSFGDGVISDDAYFFITEDGVVPGDFPEGTGAVLTPEPGSLLLSSTGAVLFGLMLFGLRRRSAVLS